MPVNERETAVFALMDIVNEGGYNNIILRKTLARHNALPPEAKAFITELVNGVLRNLIYIDYTLDAFSSVKTAEMKPFILNSLRCAVYELKFMDTPDYAVVNEAVSMCKRKGFTKLSGFVNGVLRTVCRKDVPMPDPSDAVSWLCVKYSYAEFMIKRFLKQYGFEKTERMCAANNTAPKLYIHVNTLKTDKAALKSVLTGEGVTAVDCPLFENALIISKTSDMTRLKSFRDGLFHIMDPSSMAAVYALNPRGVIADCCGAPGGKSFLAAYLSNDSGVIYSMDVYAHKIQLIKDGAARLGITCVDAVLRDAAKPYEPLVGKVDCVLVDAPCSGFGLIRRKPDIKYAKTPGDIKELQRLQRAILTASQSYVKPGGTLVYSTCTLTPEENAENAEWFLNNFDFEPSPLGLAGFGGGENSHTLEILPFEYDTDGFFISKFMKRKKSW